MVLPVAVYKQSKKKHDDLKDKLLERMSQSIRCLMVHTGCIVPDAKPIRMITQIIMQYLNSELRIKKHMITSTLTF